MNSAAVNARAVNAPEPVMPPAAAVSPPSSVTPAPVPVPVTGPFDAFKAGARGTLIWAARADPGGAPHAPVGHTAVFIGASHAVRADGRTTQVVVFEVVS